MAMKIISGRLLPLANPMKICATPSVSMSSVPEKKSSKSLLPDKAVKVVKKESLLSRLSFLFNGNMDPADPKDGPIPVNKVRIPDITELTTGEHKLYLLAFENGFIDPFCTLPVFKEGKGTKDNPVEIPSFEDSRIVACTCEPDQNFHRMFTLYKNNPKRCLCGYWMKLVQAPKFWEKIPKEDLLEITFFRDMEEDGYLDDFLAGKVDHLGHPVHADH